MKVPVNTLPNTQSGTMENREKAILQELEQVRRVNAELAALEKETRETALKRATPPPEFLPEAVAASECTYVGVAQFSVPVSIRKGSRPQPKFYITDDRGNYLDNPVSTWYRSIAFLDKKGWLNIWHQRSGEVLEIPPHNIASIKRLDKKHIPELYHPGEPQLVPAAETLSNIGPQQGAAGWPHNRLR